MTKIRVLFVCLGNICRSPTAHGVFQKMVDDENLSHVIEVDSAGTSGWHIGEQPDSRTMSVAKTRGVDLSPLRGRKVEAEDFETFDYILAMDNSNLGDLQDMEPASFAKHCGLFLDFARGSSIKEVPDPYYGGAKGFEQVFDLVEQACEGLLDQIKIDLA